MSSSQITKFTLLLVFLPLAGLVAFLLLRGNSPSQRSDGPIAPPIPIVGIGIMGDSNSDEYRADDNRGGEYASTTLNWMEQLALRRDLNFGSWGTWDEPRRTGYEYNWARSGATTSSLISSGQHTGLAKQVAAGKVSHVVLYIGVNDFHHENGPYKRIYKGNISNRDLQKKIDQMVANITTAVDTVLNAGKVQMVIVNIADPGVAPQVIASFPDPAKRQRVTEAIAATNKRIQAMANARGIYVVDLTKFGTQLLAERVDKNGFLNVGSEKINLMENGNEPHHMQLGDDSGHMGTVLSGLLANEIFVEPFNKAYGLDIEPLSEEELLQNAGIR